MGETGLEELVVYSPSHVKLPKIEVKEVKVALCLTAIKSTSGHIYIMGEIGGCKSLNL